MNINRRDLIRLVAAAGAASALTPLGLFAQGGSASPSRPLRILFLGGTGFIGPHMVQRALDRGHTVTLFNRGNNADEFPDLEQLLGDRDGKLGALEGRQWDAVVDTSGYVPRHVDDSARLLAAGGTPHYLFISTVAVYDKFDTPGMDESAPLATLADPTVEEVTGETYGALKVLCEQAVLRHYPEAHTILRPTYIVGPGDHTDRFIYYIDRPLAGGRMPVPGPQSLAINYVDVRDLAEFTIRSLEERINGIYNMVNAPGGTTFGDVMRESRAASGAYLGLVWITAEFMREHGLEWQFPMSPNPLESPANGHLSQAAAIAQGFTNRPFAETVKATYDWWMAQPAERRQKKQDVLPLEVQEAWLKAVDGAS
jgi:2'-hydroxyisoflavone reductase